MATILDDRKRDSHLRRPVPAVRPSFAALPAVLTNLSNTVCSPAQRVASPLEAAPSAHAADKFTLLAISSDTYPPSRVDVAVLFGEELAGRGHRIDWLLQSEAACDQAYVTSWAGGTVWVGAANRRPSLRSRLHKHFAGIWNDAKVFGLLKGDTYQMVEVKDKFISGVLAWWAARLHGKRFVYWLSYPFPEEYLQRAVDGTTRVPLSWLYTIRGNTFSFLLYRLLLHAADHVFVQSEAMRQAIAAKGVALSKLTAVPMGFKPQLISAVVARRELIPTTVPSVVYLGSLARIRRVDFLLRVMTIVLRETPQARLYLVGQADFSADEEYLRQEAARLGILAAVEFVGQLPQAEAFRYAQEADVCVSALPPTPVYAVSSPTKVVEYMALGKAVVADTTPDQKLLLEESGGGYCVPYDENAFAAATLKLLRAPDMARMMGERGRRYIMQHRSYQTIADEVERVMLQVVSGKDR